MTISEKSPGVATLNDGGEATGQPAAGDALALPPLPLRAGTITISDLIDLYLRHYEGRDSTRTYRLSYWQKQIGTVQLQELSDDHVHVALEELAQQRGRYFAGKDANGKPIHRARRKALSPATLNRFAASLAAVITWSIKRRIAPKGYVHPVRSIERRAEGDGRTRFLSDDERDRLLTACKASTWPRLYLLVLMALTTGARRGELTGLRWRDIETPEGYVDHQGRQLGLATIATTKNGDPRVLPLTAAVVAEMEQFRGAAGAPLFESTRRKGQVFAFQPKFDEALKSAGLRGVVFHTLRHSCASALAKNGASLLEIGDLLGHRQLQVTKRYSHLATGHKAALVNRVMGEVK